MAGRRARERGQILLDYFIALSFFLVSLGVFVDMTSAKTRAATEAERRLQAVAAAESRLAVARAGGAEAGAFQVPAPPGARGELVVTPRKDGLRQASAIVRWREAHGEESVVLLTTVLGELP